MSYFICSCFFHKNIYLQRYRLHVDYYSDEQFIEDYSEFFSSQGKRLMGHDLNDILKEVKSEVVRRRQRGKEHVERCEMVKQLYQKLHPTLYTLDESFLHPEFLKLIQYCRSESATQDGLIKMIKTESAPRVYSFPVFTDHFCRLFLEELENFENSDVPKSRPNTMNNTGILLSELGLDEGFMNKFRKDYLQIISRLLYPEWVGHSGLDSHRSHIVTYSVCHRAVEDVGLSTHYDNAEVTLNVSLGKEYSDGELYFGNMKGVYTSISKPYIYSHELGRGVIHRGQHMHGAMDISEGQRYNMIIWMRSSSVRNKHCPRCSDVPKLIPFEGYGDGFTAVTDDTK